MLFMDLCNMQFNLDQILKMYEELEFDIMKCNAIVPNSQPFFSLSHSLPHPQAFSLTNELLCTPELSVCTTNKALLVDYKGIHTISDFPFTHFYRKLCQVLRSEEPMALSSLQL